MESRLFGFSKQEVCNLAFELAQRLGIKHSFSLEKKEAGRDWFDGFIKRHPKLSLRKPEKTSAARALGFNKKNVTEFYNLYESLQHKHQFIHTADVITQPMKNLNQVPSSINVQSILNINDRKIIISSRSRYCSTNKKVGRLPKLPVTMMA